MAENLPARYANLPAPEQPSDLDGWTAEDLEGWATPAVAHLVQAEQRTEEMRVAVGLVMYRLRQEVGDGLYGEACDRIARDAKVTARTLNDWRSRAERHFQLGAPDARAEGQRRRREEERKGGGRVKKQPLKKVGAETGGAPASGTLRDDFVKRDGASLTSYVDAPAQPPLPQPRTKEDYRRLVSLVIGAGHAVLAKSVDANELAAARSVLTKALGGQEPTATRSSGTRTTIAATTMSGGCCNKPKPERSKTTGLVVCANCRTLRK